LVHNVIIICSQVNPFKTHKCDGPATTVTTNKEELLKFFTEMYRMRRMEITADMLYKAKQIRGFCHLYDGQEAVAVGMEAVLTKKDSIITSYRDHALYLSRGGTVHEIIAELMGKFTGASNGKGGSMHMYSKENNFYGGQGIVGAQVPVGAGLALAHQYMEDGSIGISMYGDGAANQGQVFESFNLAALWDLPCLFVCENNHYGMGTAEWRAAKSPAFFSRGDYMPGMKVDGMDVLAVKQAFSYAKQYALENGPMILEMDTYRYHGHSMSDPGSTYRSRDEISNIRQKRDPVEHVRRLLLDHNMCEIADLKAIEKSVKKEIDEAVEKAKNDALPPLDEVFSHVYINADGISARGARPGVFHALK
jgi:pyruvate dehydrogenase E1 component alpha subunit